jgi:AcrR family transcriptional regulator
MTREEREAARREAKEIGQAARQKAKEAADEARRKAKAAGETAREQAMEAAFAARREAEAAAHEARAGSGAGVGVPKLGEGPFGLLWEHEEPPTGRGRGRSRGRGSGLRRAEIVATALKVAEAEGPEAVSMRRIAKELDVGTMTLYHHIPTKDDLLDLMHDQVMGELVIPDDELAATWQEGLAQICRRTKEVYQRHTWMVSGAWERPQMGPLALAHVEQSLAVLRELPKDDALRALAAADDYVIGYVSRQVAAQQALQRAGLDQDDYQEALRPYVERLIVERADEYPNLARFVGENWAVDGEERFERGLQWMIAGMAAELTFEG